MPRILLIDDDDQLGPPLAAYFRRFELALTQALRHAIETDQPLERQPAVYRLREN